MVCSTNDLLCCIFYSCVKIPSHVRFWGIDSGVRHSVGGSDYGCVRVGAFMGLRMVSEMESKAKVGQGDRCMSGAKVVQGDRCMSRAKVVDSQTMFVTLPLASGSVGRWLLRPCCWWRVPRQPICDRVPVGLPARPARVHQRQGLQGSIRNAL